MNDDERLKQSEFGNKIVTFQSHVKKLIFPCFIVLFIIFAIVSQFYMPVLAIGPSMEPTIMDGTVLICDRTVSGFKTDDIVLIATGDSLIKKKIIKRIVGVPGDSLEINDGVLYVNGVAEERGFETMNDVGILKEPILLGEDEYFCLGDNRNHSSDSRVYGIFCSEQILGVIKGNGFDVKLRLFH